MPTWITVVFILLIATTIAVLFMQRRGGGIFSGHRSETGFVQGTLTVTGVGRLNEPDKNGNRYCTLSGTIIGPDTSPTEVYGTQILATNVRSPEIGTDMPVVYRPGKVDSTWRFVI